MKEIVSEIRKILWLPLSIILLVAGSFMDMDGTNWHHLLFIGAGITIGIGITKGK